MSPIIEVAIAVPLHKSFDYLCERPVAVGARVKVSFGRKKVVGVVLSHKQKSDFSQLKSVDAVLDDEPILSSDILKFLFWSSNYYHHPIGEVLASAMPKNLRLGKPAEIKKARAFDAKTSAPDFETTAEQNKAVDTILASLNQYNGYLLHGVTGSGKTEVYLRITETLLNKDKQVLVLVPEIGLTPQMIARFEQRINGTVVAIHSQLNETQKTDAYLMAANGKASVVLGTRSAIFAPMPNLGLVIVDEEHDASFKQQSSFRYSARDLSFIRAKLAKVPLILGTATPSLETLKNVTDNKLTRLVLSARPGATVMPEVNLIDMRSQSAEALSLPLVDRMRQHLQNGNQVMLFINRRGYAPVFYCTECDWRAGCEHCDAQLIYHRGFNRLKCHHCGAEQMPQSTCPSCQQSTLKVLGYGTERLEENLESYFPDTPVIRIDRDTTRRKKAFAKHLEQINSGEPCIIIGTQMLAKGHDFSQLAFVGILDVDVGLLSLDFRATENLAQLLIQVSGRAGRAEHKGEVAIQTRYPNHPIFEYVRQAHYTQYASTLLKERQDTQLPPFSHQAILCANAKNKTQAEDFLNDLAQLLRSIDLLSVEIWGPVPGVIEKKADYFYFNLYLQSSNRQALHQMLNTMYEHIDSIKASSSVRWFLDVDPIE